jgi:SPP1 gp7 family putative phage head morphogenesis protein
VTLCEGKITTLMTKQLKAKGKEISLQVVEAYAELHKAAKKSPVEKLMETIDFDWKDIADDLQPLLEQTAKDGAKVGADQLEVVTTIALDQANDRAIAYANARSAELIGMKRNKAGKLVPNPNADWSITKTTRNLIRADVTTAMEEGWSNDQLANKIETSYAFSQDRAAMIARTETAMADVAGNMAAYIEAEKAGVVVKKKWITAEDDKVSEDCRMNGQAKPRALSAVFPSGAFAPPEHPRCRCDVLPVVEE